MNNRNDKVKPQRVVRAIDGIVSEHGTPVLITFESLARQIVADEMADEGIEKVPAAMLSRNIVRVQSELRENGLLKAGCERYARQSTKPFTLVTQFFLDYIGEDNDLADSLEEMTEEEVKRALPAKPFFHVDKNGVVDRSIMYAGEHQGAVIAETGSRFRIILANERRHFKNNAKGLETLGKRSDRVLPEHKAMVIKGALSGASIALLKQARTSPLQIAKD